MSSNIKKKIRSLSQKSDFLSKLYVSASGMKANSYRKMNDEEYVKKMYKRMTGIHLDLDNPRSFNEKIQWLKLYYHKPEFTTMVDKYLVKDYISQKIGLEYVVPLLGVWDSPDEIDFGELPDKFVLKCNHNSGEGMYICSDKSLLNENKVREGLYQGLKQDYYLFSREWPYKNVEKKIIAEQYLEDSKYGSIYDYKFYCFNGDPKFLYVGYANFVNGKKNDQLTYLNIDWTPSEFYRTDHDQFPFELIRPARYEEMVRIASILSKDIPFVRVDLYYVNDSIYFSEFTFSPGGGYGIFKPQEWEEKMGEWIHLPELHKDTK